MEKTNSFNGGTNGAGVTAANSGGTSGTALDDTYSSGVTYTSTNATGARSPLVCKLANLEDYGYVGWSAVTPGSGRTLYFRIYAYLTGYPPDVQYSIAGTFTDAGSGIISLNLSPTGKLGFMDQSGTVYGATTNSVAQNQWVRIEGKLTFSTSSSNGSGEIRYYATAGSATATETKTVSSVPLGTTLPYYFDVLGGIGLDYYVDDIGVSDVTWLGPVESTSLSITPSGISSGQAFGTAKINRTIPLTGIASGEAFGTAKLGLNVKPLGISSGEVWGTSNIGGAVVPTGIPTQEAWGSPAVYPQQKVTLTGISSLESFGGTVVAYPQDISLEGMPSEETWRNPKVRLVIGPASIASQEYWWAPEVKSKSRYVLRPPSVQETPMARNILHIRYGIHRGISIIRRPDGTYYQTRYPAQTEIEEASRTYLGGHVYPLTSEEANELTSAGYGDYITLEHAS